MLLWMWVFQGGRDPPGSVHQQSQVYGQVPGMERLMMGNTVPELAKLVKGMMQPLASDVAVERASQTDRGSTGFGCSCCR